MQNISTEHFETPLKSESKKRFQRSQDDFSYSSLGSTFQSFQSLLDQTRPQTSSSYHSYSSTSQYQNQLQATEYNQNHNNNTVNPDHQYEAYHTKKGSTQTTTETEIRQSEHKISPDQKPQAKDAKQTPEQVTPELAKKAAQVAQKTDQTIHAGHTKQTISGKSAKLSEKAIQENNGENSTDRKIDLNIFANKNDSIEKTIIINEGGKAKNLEKKINALPQKITEEIGASENHAIKEKADLLKGSLGTDKIKNSDKYSDAKEAFKAGFQSKEILEKALTTNNKKSSSKTGVHNNKNESHPEQIVSRETIQSNNTVEAARIDVKKQEGWKPENITQYRSAENISKKINTENLSSKMESNLDFQNNSSDMGFDKLLQAQKVKESPVLRTQIQQQISQMFSRARVILRENGNANMTTNLYPKELGKISIRLSLVDGKLTGKFTVDNEIVQKELHQRMDKIMEELKSDGYEVSQFQVNVRSENNGQEAHHAKPEQKNISQSYQSSARSVKTQQTVSEQKSGGLYA